MDQIATTIGAGIMAAGIAGVLWCLFMLRRNRWVYEQRMSLLTADFGAYQELVSYDAMMRRFWVWDIDAFRATQP